MPDMSGMGLGTIAKVSGLSLGTIQKISGLGLGLIWQAVSFIQVGASKSTTVSIGTSWTKITNLVADTTNYPGSVVTNNALVVAAGGTNKTLSAGFTFTPPGAANTTAQIRIKKNGTTIIGTGVQVSVPAFSSGNAFCVVTGVTIANNDYFEVEAIMTSFAGNCTVGYLRALNP